ncbi:MAG: hypothetical protein GEU90_04105 [Gemmatimonas sp.]|nr:hypothetical protein [Gemmatimonas sp.]
MSVRLLGPRGGRRTWPIASFQKSTGVFEQVVPGHRRSDARPAELLAPKDDALAPVEGLLDERHAVAAAVGTEPRRVE